MKSEDKKTLRLFQCDYNRELEEMFSQTFCENEKIRVFFINENEAFTDGKNIVVDPAVDTIFADRKALERIEKYLNSPPVFSNDSWFALRMITRAQNIHESLHIIYSDFSPVFLKNSSFNTRVKQKTMSLISNIIEDAYIEAVGCSVYDNLELYLKFGRLSRVFATHQLAGTVEKVFSEEDVNENPKIEPILEFLNYMIVFMLYPMINQENPLKEIAEYVDKTKQFFLDGSIAPSPDERYDFSKQIFEIIEPLIPNDDAQLDFAKFGSQLYGLKTHSTDASTMGRCSSKGKSQAISTRLFTDLDRNTLTVDYKDQISNIISEFEKQKQVAFKIVTYKGSKNVYLGSDFDCAVLHKAIKINEKKPKINLNLRKAYQNIFNRYHININSYNSRFLHLLKSNVPMKEEKHSFGSGISSKLFGDSKKRYWYRNVHGVDVPDIAVLLLIDGSGSMMGNRKESAMISSVILHEVLKKQGISHAVIEHRGGFDKPEIDINILVSFDAREEEKYNLMQIDAYGDNRDGLALFWAEKYINEQVHCESKLIIVLSDGAPAHEADKYYPPVSTKDTANAATKIMKRGTNIIAIALDEVDSFNCYDMLKAIYPNIISCNDLKRLTGQILTLVSKQLR